MLGVAVMLGIVASRAAAGVGKGRTLGRRIATG
jgi:hypothetical protein